jgi:hypothetical protein
MGFEREAREILLDRARLSRRSLRQPARVLSWIFDALFEYGLSTRAALVTVAWSWLAGTALFAVAHQAGAFSAIQPREVDIRFCDAISTSIVYAADTLLPIVDLRAESRCEIDDPANQVAFVVPAVALFETATSEVAVTRADIFRLLKAVYGMWGWIVATCSVLTFTGFLRRFGGTS